ncbi:MAG: FtsX-like permease family protein, partial [Acidobacteria bacterium]|nr:FtsX-like permease family protein [Acidobacteriota bacterium]
CFNMANLLLARTTAREKEVSTRLAIGASPGRILQQFLVEGVVLSVGAVLLGLPLSLWLARWVGSLGLIFVVPLTLHNLNPNPHVLAFCGAAGLATGILVSAVPALRATRPDLVSALKGRHVFDLRDAVVVVQVACALVMLAGAVLLAGSLERLKATPLGYDPHNLLLASIETRSANFSVQESQRLYRTLLVELRSQRIIGAALASEALPSAVVARKEVTPMGAAQALSIDFNSVSDG